MVPSWGWLIIPAWWLAAAALRLLPDWGIGPVEQVRRIIVLLVALFGSATGMLFLSKTGADISRLTLTLGFVFSIILLPMIRQQVKRLMIQCKLWGVPTVIYGANATSTLEMENINDN